MSVIKTIFDACASILKADIYVMGYRISLMEVIIYGFCMYILFLIVREFLS